MESEKETQIVILINSPILTKDVIYQCEDYRPFYIDLGLISKISSFRFFIISLIFSKLP